LSPLFDSHVHLDIAGLGDAQLAAELESARSLGWRGAVIAGYGPVEIDRSAVICDQHRELRRAIGLHPWWLADHADDADALDAAWRGLRMAVDAAPPVALGEFGLDRGVADRLPLAEQEVWMQRGLALAAEVDLPVILHVVGAPGRSHALLRPFARSRLGILHRYSGSAQMVPGFEALGLFLSLSPSHLRRNPERAKAVAQAISEERLLVETDWAGGQQSYTSAVQAMGEMVTTLARWRGVEGARLAAAVVANATTIYGTHSQTQGES